MTHEASRDRCHAIRPPVQETLQRGRRPEQRRVPELDAPLRMTKLAISVASFSYDGSPLARSLTHSDLLRPRSPEVADPIQRVRAWVLAVSPMDAVRGRRSFLLRPARCYEGALPLARANRRAAASLSTSA